MPKMNSETSVRGSARAQHRAPGSRASTVRANVWNLCFRAVSRSRTGLSKYFHLLLSHPACSQRAPQGKIWPVPLPFPEMHVRKSNRRQFDAPRKLALNYVILILNWLFLGQGPLECWFAWLGHEVEQVPVADSHPAATFDRLLELA